MSSAEKIDAALCASASMCRPRGHSPHLSTHACKPQQWHALGQVLAARCYRSVRDAIPHVGWCHVTHPCHFRVPVHKCGSVLRLACQRLGCLGSTGNLRITRPPMSVDVVQHRSSSVKTAVDASTCGMHSVLSASVAINALIMSSSPQGR